MSECVCVCVCEEPQGWNASDIFEEKEKERNIYENINERYECEGGSER